MLIFFAVVILLVSDLFFVLSYGHLPSCHHSCHVHVMLIMHLLKLFFVAILAAWYLSLSVLQTSEKSKLLWTNTK